jgi:DNA-binding NarL/FixJ family response regulator
MAKIRVVLADNHQEVVARVRRTLGEDFDVIGTVEDGNQAVDAVRVLDADVLVIDISMPISNGREAAKRLLEVQSRFLTIHEDQDFVTAAISAGPPAMSPSPAFLSTWSQRFARRCRGTDSFPTSEHVTGCSA